MRILGIDYGDSRCGFAITDALNITVQALETLQCEGNDKMILKKIDWIDERLTTVAAHKTMNFLNVDKHKKRNIVDTISAVYILETYVNKNKQN